MKDIMEHLLFYRMRKKNSKEIIERLVMKDKQIELIKEWRAESKKNWISLSTATDVNRIYNKCADQLEKLVGEVAEKSKEVNHENPI